MLPADDKHVMQGLAAAVIVEARSGRSTCSGRRCSEADRVANEEARRQLEAESDS